MTQHNKGLLLPLLVICLLPGCWPKNENRDSKETSDTVGKPASLEGEVLVQFGGKAAITVDEFNEALDELEKTQPQIATVVRGMPDAQRRFLEGMITQKVINFMAEEKGINKTQAYKEKIEKLVEKIKEMVNAEELSKHYQGPTPTEGEKRKMYEDNKQHLVKAEAGVKAQGVSFDSKEKAQEFLNKAQSVGGDLLEVAKKENIDSNKAHDFGVVNDKSTTVSPKVRDTIVETTKIPSTKMVVDGKTTWVVRVVAKQDAEYHPYEQFEGKIHEGLQTQSNQQELLKKIEDKKKDLDIKVNESYFAKKGGNPMGEALGEEEEPASAPVQGM